MTLVPFYIVTSLCLGGFNYCMQMTLSSFFCKFRSRDQKDQSFLKRTLLIKLGHVFLNTLQSGKRGRRMQYVERDFVNCFDYYRFEPYYPNIVVAGMMVECFKAPILKIASK